MSELWKGIDHYKRGYCVELTARRTLPEIFGHRLHGKLGKLVLVKHMFHKHPSPRRHRVTEFFLISVSPWFTTDFLRPQHQTGILPKSLGPRNGRIDLLHQPKGRIFEAEARPKTGSQKVGADPAGIANLISLPARLLQAVPGESAQAKSNGQWQSEAACKKVR